MPPQPLRVPRIVILTGYLILTVGTALTVWGERSGNPYYPKGFRVYDLATVVNFALLGWAWWTHLNALQSTSTLRPQMRRSFRIFAAAAGVLAVGYVALIRDIVANAVHYSGYQVLLTELYHLPDGHPLYKGMVLTVIGFCIVAVGFWWASRTSTTLPESSDVTSGNEAAEVPAP
jgi:uncharacterized membrane protein